jgi:hypothetical protein
VSCPLGSGQGSGAVTPPSRRRSVWTAEGASEPGVVCPVAKVVDEAGKQPECRDDRDTEQQAEKQIRE